MNSFFGHIGNQICVWNCQFLCKYMKWSKLLFKVLPFMHWFVLLVYITICDYNFLHGKNTWATIVNKQWIKNFSCKKFYSITIYKFIFNMYFRTNSVVNIVVDRYSVNLHLFYVFWEAFSLLPTWVSITLFTFTKKGPSISPQSKSPSNVMHFWLCTLV